MNEAASNLLGLDLASEAGVAFAARAMTTMRERLATYQEETGHLYNLEATPAEGATYRFAKADKELFGEQISCANEEAWRQGADPYYTNSTQLPVMADLDLFDALERQEPLQNLYTGGTVFHCFLGERLPSGEAAKRLVRRVAERFSLPYYTLTPTFSICPIHGYLPGEHEFCPRCDAEREGRSA